MLFETVLRAFRNVHLQGVLIGKRVGRYLNGACEAKEICHFFQKKIVDNFGSFEKKDYLCTRNRENDERL
jgi:hypothetical protein